MCYRALEFSEKIFLHKLKETYKGRIIICEEDLSGNVMTGGLHGCVSVEFAQRLRKVLPEIKVVIFIRHQLRMLESVYSYYLKVGGTEKLDFFLCPKSTKREFVSPRFSLNHLEYDKLIGYYDSLFGSENVYVYCYEDFCSNNRNFLTSYSGELGLKINLDEVNLVSINKKSSYSSLKILRLMNHFTRKGFYPRNYYFHIPKWDKATIHALRMFDLIFSKNIDIERILPESIILEMLDRFSASNRRLAEMRKLPLTEWNYPQ